MFIQKMIPTTVSSLLSFTVLLASFTDVLCVRHIVLIVADDLGWNDVGFHNPDMITPNIDKLATSGVILNSSYVQPVCTPSRHAFMTGTYPFKHGLQSGVIMPAEPSFSPLNLKFLPESLKDLGYKTHMLGKWHLGSCNDSVTPTFRGFDSFLGYYNGQEDYYTKEVANGKDFNDGIKPINPVGEYADYSARVYAKAASNIIRSHDKFTPLFLYMAFQSVHEPIQVPKNYENMYPNIKNIQRRQYCGMVTAMDEAIGNITDALRETGLMDDTLIIFTPDNGGWPTYGGNNYPLRGGKITIFEGGTRAAAFVHGAGLEKKGYTYNGLIHAVDWNPTIIAAAGGRTEPLNGIDGINQWDALSAGEPSKRNEFVYNLDDALFAVNGHAAIRVGDFKLIDGYPGPYNGWYKPDEVENNELYQFLLKSEKEKLYYEKQVQNEWMKYKIGESFTGDGLYNLKDDPNEHVDISKDNPEIVKQLKDKLAEYRKQLVKPFNPRNDPAALPTRHGGHWVPGWC